MSRRRRRGRSSGRRRRSTRAGCGSLRRPTGRRTRVRQSCLCASSSCVPRPSSGSGAWRRRTRPSRRRTASSAPRARPPPLRTPPSAPTSKQPLPPPPPSAPPASPSSPRCRRASHRLPRRSRRSTGRWSGSRPRPRLYARPPSRGPCRLSTTAITRAPTPPGRNRVGGPRSATTGRPPSLCAASGTCGRSPRRSSRAASWRSSSTTRRRAGPSRSRSSASLSVATASCGRRTWQSPTWSTRAPRSTTCSAYARATRSSGTRGLSASGTARCAETATIGSATA
mmetsp:Transcript_24309/g.71874  ORF Transcript_24309/g.71874 Transcript_24309/m.71874 type:complete len:283 (+) Transcript_24309:1404-2252(+)